MMSEFHLNNESERTPASSNKSKKAGGPMSIIKVALHRLRNKKGQLKKSNNMSALSATTNTTLTHIMGSVRPLYLQSSVGDGDSPPPPTLHYSAVDERVVATTMSPEQQQETSSFHTASISRCSSSRSSSLGGGMSSKYASVQSLYDLDNHDDYNTIEEEIGIEDNVHGDAYYESLEADALIDAKAELFIANFYQQMRLQN
ncbi:hypothetical protein vseg_003284 [Gypsophila vaccaria]